MKYIVSWSLPQATFHMAVSRFLQAGGMPPSGVKMLGRWHGMSGRGFAVVETTDAKALYAWVAEWSDLLALETTPCLEDADAGAVLQSLKRQGRNAMIEDAAKVAPHVYKVVFENDRVRVLEARLGPGVKTQMHQHPAQVVYGLSGGTTKLTHPGGDSVEVEVRRGEVVFFEPEAHATANVGGTEVHVLMVEPK